MSTPKWLPTLAVALTGLVLVALTLLGLDRLGFASSWVTAYAAVVAALGAVAFGWFRYINTPQFARTLDLTAGTSVVALHPHRLLLAVAYTIQNTSNVEVLIADTSRITTGYTSVPVAGPAPSELETRDAGKDGAPRPGMKHVSKDRRAARFPNAMHPGESVRNEVWWVVDHQSSNDPLIFETVIVLNTGPASRLRRSLSGGSTVLSYHTYAVTCFFPRTNVE